MKWQALAARAALILIGFGCAGGVTLLTLQLFPDLRPGGQRFIFTELDGDTFHHQPGFVRPPQENRELENFIIRHDENGFRQPKKTADYYPIIALGDSYTEGGEVNWVDVLAQELDTPAQNLAWRGFGTLEQAEIMQQFGSDDHKWVLLGFFEGNDLSNIQSAYEQLQQTGELNIARESAPPQGNTERPTPVPNPDDNYLYPLKHFIGDQIYELAYISDYIWWLNGTEDVYRQSHNIERLAEALRQIKHDAGNACLGLVYMPNKGHIYFEYSDPQGNQRYVLENGLSLELSDNNWLTFAPMSAQDRETVLSNLDHQRNVVREIAQDSGWQFIDLTPAFKAAVLTGEPSYYVYDSHWNARGHRIAGETVAQYLQAQSESCPL